MRRTPLRPSSRAPVATPRRRWGVGGGLGWAPWVLLLGVACGGSNGATGNGSEDAIADGDTGGSEDAGTTPDLVERMVAMIRTDVDPEYEYAYEGSKFVPPPGQTLLILGQTLGGIDEHVASFPDEPLPGGWAAYWGIPSMDGVTSTFLNETGGRQNHQQLVERFPNMVLQSACWMVGTWDVAKRAGDGEFDDVVRQYGAWAKEVDRPIYLRIGYEFDGPHNELEPGDYVRAYRHIVDLMREEGVENVAFVWHSYASEPYNGHALSDWYPGDDYVDWVGISLFGHSYVRVPSRHLEAVFEFAKDEKKPVMIAEASPTRGIDGRFAWNDWFVNFLSLAYERNIKAISLINENWERFTFPGLDWGDARLQNDPDVSAAWFLETNKDRYLKASPELFRQLGYE